MTTTTDTLTATETTAANLALAEAFAEVAGILTNRAELPPVSHGSFNTHRGTPYVDLWFEEPEHVDAWADALGATTRTMHSGASAERPFVVRKAAEVIKRHYVLIELTQMDYLDTDDTAEPGA